MGLAVLGTIVLGCGGVPVETGLPLDDPASFAERLRETSAVDAPAFVRFDWDYGDQKGRLSGEGVARVTPPDSFRLDLFSSGEGSMAAVLADDRLSTLGQIDDVELPAPRFLYAMAGVFRPGPVQPSEGYRDGGEKVLVYTGNERLTQHFRFRDGRLLGVEERDGGRIVRSLEIVWGDDEAWPRHAEYRDRVAPRRVRWELVEARSPDVAFPPDIYELDGRR